MGYVEQKKTTDEIQPERYLWFQKYSIGAYIIVFAIIYDTIYDCLLLFSTICIYISLNANLIICSTVVIFYLTCN